MNEDERDQGLTEADVTSETRFGPRPVPEGHIRPNSPYESRHIPPSGDVSPDGTRAWPHPSNTSKLLVWGGIAVAAAAVTAGAVMAGKYVGDLLSEEDEKPRRPSSRHEAPHHEDMLYAARQAAPRRDFQRELDDAAARGRAEGEAALRREAARRRAAAHADEAARPRRQRARRAKGLVEDIQDNTHRLNSSVNGILGSLGAALSGFRSVAGQAGSIVSEFSDAAQTIRSFLDRTATAAKDRAEEAGEKVKDEVKRRTHNL